MGAMRHKSMQLEARDHKAYLNSVPNGQGRRTWLKYTLPYFLPRVVFNFLLPFNLLRNGFCPSKHERQNYIQLQLSMLA